MPYELESSETTGFKECDECGQALLERDRYCRRCGVRQPERASAGNMWRHASHHTSSTALSYQSVSGSLVNAVTRGIAADTTARLRHRAVKGLVFALISLPIWLLIVLLSPLDAWAAARAATTQL